MSDQDDSLPPSIMDSVPRDALGPGFDPTPGLASIQAADPGWDRTLFLSQAQAGFFALKAAIQARDLAKVSYRLSEGALAFFQNQVDQLVADHLVHRYDNLVLDQFTISRAAHGPTGDSIAVRFDGRAIQYIARETGGDAIYGDHTTVHPFIEYWTFVRSAGVTTHLPFAVECPHCGAPIAAGAGPTCRFCRAALPSRPTLDWMIAAVQDPIDFGVV